MIGQRQVVTFDTSAHNRLAEGGPISESTCLGISYGMHFRFAGLSVEEVVGTSDQAKRECLLQWCGRLQAGPSDCLLPPTDLLRALVFAHRTNSPSFDWKTVDARAVEFERGIQRRKVILSPQLSSKAREEQAILQKQVRHVFTQMRPEIQTLFEANRVTPPDTFREAVAQGSGNNAMGMWEKWVLGKCKILYDGFGETEASEGVVAEFLEACPPFRAYVYGMLMQEYDRAIKPKNTGQRFKAGYNDLAMSVYLPYCDKFVTAEKKGEQEKCLREIVGVANLNTDILSYDIFCDSFLVKI